MKYGLICEDKASKRSEKQYWKVFMENDIKTLKNEVSILQKQFEKLHDIVQHIVLSSPAEFTPPCADLPTNSNLGQQIDIKISTKQNEHVKFYEVMKTTLPSPNTIQDLSAGFGTLVCTNPNSNCDSKANFGYDDGRKVVRHCISCSPTFSNKSLEELRLEDYVLCGRLNSTSIWHHQPLPNQRRIVKATKPTEKFKNGKLVQRKFSLKKPSLIWQANEENVHRDTEELLGNQQTKTHIFQRFDFTTSHCQPGTPTFKREELLSQVVSELKNLNSSFSKVDLRLSVVESNLTNLSAQVSVVDSKLSAVDMFVTMERFDKKWQTLKPRLASLESTPCKSDGGMMSFEGKDSFQITKDESNLETLSEKSSSSDSSRTSAVAPVKEDEFFSNKDAFMNVSTTTSTSAENSQLDPFVKDGSTGKMDISNVSQSVGPVFEPLSNTTTENKTDRSKNLDCTKHVSFQSENGKHCKQSKSHERNDLNTDVKINVLKTSNLCDITKNHFSAEQDVCRVMPAATVKYVDNVPVVKEVRSNLISDLSYKILEFSETNSSGNLELGNDCSFPNEKIDEESSLFEKVGSSQKLGAVSVSNKNQFCKLSVSPHFCANSKDSNRKEVLSIIEKALSEETIDSNKKEANKEETSSDDGSEYEFVQNKDVDDCEKSPKENEVTSNLNLKKVFSPSFSFSRNFKACANTTEYLEVKCRRNDAVEFGTEAKPESEETKPNSEYTKPDSEDALPDSEDTKPEGEETEPDSTEAQAESPLCVDKGAVTTTVGGNSSTKENKPSTTVNDDSFIKFVSEFAVKSAGQQSSPFTFEGIQVVKPIGLRMRKAQRRKKSTAETITTNLSDV